MTKTLISRQARVLTRTIVSGFGQLQLVMVMARTATEQNRLKAHSSRSPAVPLSNSWGKYTPINKCAKIMSEFFPSPSRVEACYQLSHSRPLAVSTLLPLLLLLSSALSLLSTFT